MADTKFSTKGLVHPARHWHYLRRRRSLKKDHTIKEMFIGQLFSMVGSVVAGLVLDYSTASLLLLVGALMILPGIFELGGSVAGAMGARIAHRLDEGFPARAVVIASLRHAFSLLLSSAVILSVIAGAVGVAFVDGNFAEIAPTVFLTCVLTGTIGLPVVAWMTWISFKKGADPDNIIGPFETTLFDLLSVTMLAVVVRLTV